MEQKIYTPHFFTVLSVLHDVENRIQKPFSMKEFKRLFSELENLQKECCDEQLLRKIVYLYGKIVDKYVDGRLKTIVSIAKKNRFNSSELQKKIAEIKLYGLSKENFTTLSQIEQRICNQDGSKETSPEELNSVEELFTLAGFIYHRQKEHTKRSYRMLTIPAKESLGKHLTALNTSLFQNDISTIQALFAAAYELAGRPLEEYPNSKEIRDFFTQREEIIGEDSNETWMIHRAN